MNIFVVGANGQIGRHLIQKLGTTEHQVYAGVRDVANQAIYDEENIAYVPFDLTWSSEKMGKPFKRVNSSSLLLVLKDKIFYKLI